jgi:hypothetical protein
LVDMAAASIPPAAGSPVNTTAVASIELPAAPGGYRPGGTSSYPTTQASAVNIATRPANSESSSSYPSSRYSTPSTTIPSSNGAPSYR